MHRSSNISRSNLTEKQNEERETFTKLEGEKYYRNQLEIAEQMDGTERPAVLSQILESDLAMPQNSMREILTKISFATFDLQDDEVNQINEKIIKKFSAMVQGRTIDSAAHDLKGIAEIMLTATIIRSDKVISYLQTKLTEAAGEIKNQLFAEYMFDTLINPYNLIQCKDINRLISTASSLISFMPQDAMLKCIINLYRALPDQAKDRLICLEAIINHATKLPESHDSMTVLSMINQEIYKLRLENT
jgi:hypothetical protein